ncbi:uncharacterized protein LOC123874010 [Maniola jurtina]|uniref:uncharacterized protein LOC123874010 n=1 Tax=Maniola jurtina TaxID=191418 RepID=UPI001E688BCE|nr:uncharacterized protein LOC123874010 [Maniola jurtina]
MYKLVMISCVLVMVAGWPQMFATNTFKVGIEYQNSLPMGGGSERYRHRNNLDPFYVTVTASAKNGYVITYLEVETTTDITGEVEFDLVQGQTGSKTMVFQLISNQTDFLKYNYLVYGIREEEYKKLHNIITIQMRNSSAQLLFHNCFMIIVLITIKIRSSYDSNLAAGRFFTRPMPENVSHPIIVSWKCVYNTQYRKLRQRDSESWGDI